MQAPKTHSGAVLEIPVIQSPKLHSGAILETPTSLQSPKMHGFGIIEPASLNVPKMHGFAVIELLPDVVVSKLLPGGVLSGASVNVAKLVVQPVLTTCLLVSKFTVMAVLSTGGGGEWVPPPMFRSPGLERAFARAFRRIDFSLVSPAQAQGWWPWWANANNGGITCHGG